MFLTRPDVRRNALRLTARRLRLELWKRSGGDRLHDEKVVTVGDGARMALRPANAIEGTIYTYGFSEFPVGLAFMKTITSGMVVVDVGSNIGEYALLAARRAGASGKVLAFEPNPAPRERLLENLRLNRLANVEVLPLALSSKSGKGALHVPLDNPDADEGWASLKEFPGDRRVQTIPVELKTLDGAVADAGLSHVDVLKIDVEGAEADVVAGATASLRRDRPVVFLEVHVVYRDGARVSAEAVDLLRREGYRVFDIEVVGPDQVDLVEVADGTIPRSDPATWRQVNLVAVHDETGRELASRVRL